MRNPTRSTTPIVAGLLGATVLALTLLSTPQAATAAVCVNDPLRFLVIDGGAASVVSMDLSGNVTNTVPTVLPAGVTDIGTRSDQAGYWAMPWGSNQLISIDAVTGATTTATYPALIAGTGLEGEPDGHVVYDNAEHFFDLDPVTGVVTQLAVSLPTNWGVDGDITTLPDGRVLVPAYDTTTTSSDSTLYLLDPADPTNPKVVGLVPEAWGIKVFDGNTYFATDTGDVLRYTGVPTTPSTAFLPTTVLDSFGPTAQVVGAAGLWIAVCSAAPDSSGSAAPTASASTPVASMQLPTLAKTGPDTGISLMAAGAVAAGAIALTVAAHRRRRES